MTQATRIPRTVNELLAATDEDFAAIRAALLDSWRQGGSDLAYAVEYCDPSPEHIDAWRDRTPGLLTELRRIRAERKAEQDTRIDAILAGTDRSRPFGAGGVRYDEACEICGSLGEVDNISNYCRRHH